MNILRKPNQDNICIPFALINAEEEKIDECAISTPFARVRVNSKVSGGDDSLVLKNFDSQERLN